MKNDQGTKCRPDMHVWQRPEAERNNSVPQDRYCDCAVTGAAGITFDRLKDGASYLLEYVRSDGTIISGGIHVKKSR